MISTSYINPYNINHPSSTNHFFARATKFRILYFDIVLHQDGCLPHKWPARMIHYCLTLILIAVIMMINM